MADRLLLERNSLAGIARSALVSESRLQKHVNKKYKATPRLATVTDKKKGRLTVECDEMWSFVFKKENWQWIWPAIDRDTREIIGVYAGRRDRSGALLALWNSLPPVYRQCAVSYTDFQEAYNKVLPG